MAVIIIGDVFTRAQYQIVFKSRVMTFRYRVGAKLNHMMTLLCQVYLFFHLSKLTVHLLMQHGLMFIVKRIIVPAPTALDQ